MVNAHNWVDSDAGLSENKEYCTPCIVCMLSFFMSLNEVRTMINIIPASFKSVPRRWRWRRWRKSGPLYNPPGGGLMEQGYIYISFMIHFHIDRTVR